MWMTRGAAFSDVVLAPAGIVLGTGLIGLFPLVPGWPNGVVGGVVVLVAATLLMIGWPTWLAHQRDDTVTGGGVRPGELGLAVVVALPVVIAGTVNLLIQGSPLSRAVAGNVSNVPPSPTGIVRVLLFLVMGVGTYLVLVLVARRAPTAFENLDMSIAAGLRSYGLGLAVAATVLYGLYAFDTGRPFTMGPVVGVAVAATVLLVDAQVPAGAGAPRGAILAAPVVAAVLWILSGGLFLLGGDLLPRLALASVAAPLALCVGALVLVKRTWAAALVPVAATVWLVSILPTVV